MSAPTFVTAVKWIPRGVAAQNPHTIKVEATTIKQLIESTNMDETTDTDDATSNQPSGLRGSDRSKKEIKHAAGEDKFNMKEYDNEPEGGPTMKGLAIFSNLSDDPYITSHKDDSEDEREHDALKIKPEDNLCVAAKFDGDDTTLLVYVYNSNTGDFYVHHDYPIAAPVLCLENIGYDPGVDNKRGNLLAVGTMNPQIEIWDLDILNAVKPVVKLGSTSTGNRKKRDCSEQCHTDSVLSLSWNRETDHLLASGGADQMVVLWDLDAAKPAQNLQMFDGMVQTLEWQPKQSSILLSGTRMGTLRLDDGRADVPVANWNFKTGNAEIEVESVFWDRQNEHNVYVLTSDGKLRFLDTRNAGEVVTTIQAHDNEETGGLSLSSIGGLLTTVGGEQAKFWSNKNGQIELIASKTFHMGKLRAVSFCPDAGGILMLGGEKEDLIHIFDIARLPQCASAFPNLKPSADVEKLDQDESQDAEMAEE